VSTPASQKTDDIRETDDAREKVVEVASAWVERTARFGYIAQGTVYTMVGILTAQAAIGVRGTPDGTECVLVEILRQPFGQFLLAGTAAGLDGYVLWRFAQAFVDPAEKGTDALGLAQRTAYVLSSLAYASLAAPVAIEPPKVGNTTDESCGIMMHKTIDSSHGASERPRRWLAQAGFRVQPSITSVGCRR
jgi:hypothetical protein